MARILFDFSELFVNCIHEEDFTNAIKREKIKVLLANSFMIMQDCSSRDWEEFEEYTNNCHEVNEYIKHRIGKLINWNKKEIAELERKHVWQIPIGEEARLFGILEKNKPIKHNNLFQVLLFDPNHKTYRRRDRNVLANLKDLVCLFTREDKCQEAIVQKSLGRSRRLK